MNREPGLPLWLKPGRLLVFCVVAAMSIWGAVKGVEA